MLNFFTILRLRGEWEILALKFVGVNQNGTLDSLRDFLSKGHRKNRFREGYDRAVELAEEILELADE